jgi:hypothetical protein
MGLVMLDGDLTLADGAIRSDGVVLVVSQNNLWFLKSQKGFPTSVVVGSGG